MIAAYGMARGFDSTLIALFALVAGAIAAFAAFAILAPRSGRTTPASLQSALALAALASASADRVLGFDAGVSLEQTALGGIVAIALVFVLSRVRVGISNARLMTTMHFGCAALCTVIAYTAGFEGGAVAVVIIGAMVALIGAYLAMAMADRAYPVFIAALNGYAACSVVAAGVGLANGALVVTGVALVLGCVATCTNVTQAGARIEK